MGKTKSGTRSFIDKKTAATYHLLYRPSQDGETVGQDSRMFVRADRNWDGDHDENGLEVQNDLYGGHANYEEQDEELEAQHEAKREEKKAELLQLGFQDDGYDYNQHLRVIGGENSVGQTMFVPTKAAKPVRLAPDQRAYDAQQLDKVPENPFEADMRQSRARSKPSANVGTLANELEELEAAMDSDLEDDEDWVLNDDFVQGALAPSEGDAGSSSQAGPSRPQMLTPPVEEEEQKEQGEQEEEEEEEEKEEPESDDEFSSVDASDGEYAATDAGTERSGPAGGSRAPMSAKQRALDEAFERLAMDYEDDDIGELDDEQENTLGTNDVMLYERTFDKFLDEKALDGELDNGQYIAVGKGTEGWNKVADQETAEAALAKTHELGRRMQKDEAEGRRYEENVLTTHAVQDLEELWDCETIVSTYSNLDNHPGLIKDDSVRKKSAARAAARAAAAAADAASGPVGQIKLSR